MDLEEWELLSDDGFIDLSEEGERKRVFISKANISPTNNIIDMNYFPKFMEPQNISRVLPLEINLFDGMELPQEVTKLPINPEIPTKEEAISQVVFFKKLKENEFVDMKMDSPKSINRGFFPQIDVGTYQFEEKDGEFFEKGQNSKEKSVNLEDEVTWENHDDDDDGGDDDDGDDGLKIWKWPMTGIGALFSFGFAAVTVSLIVLGSRQHKEKMPQKSQELHYQIYTHDKRMKQVVHHATKLNEAITAVRGAPFTRAQITIGGYYEGL